VAQPPGEDRSERERSDEQEDDEPEAGESDPVAAEADPDELPVITCLDLELDNDARRDAGCAVTDGDVDLVDRAHETSDERISICTS
jgi:hypothetical protein